MSYSLTECVPSETASTSSVIIRLRSSTTTAGRHEKDMTLTDGETSYPGFSGEVSGHRLYSPMLERWLNRDPLGEEAFVTITVDQRFRINKSGRNNEIQSLYRFVRNSPENMVDTLGCIGHGPVHGGIIIIEIIFSDKAGVQEENEISRIECKLRNEFNIPTDKPCEWELLCDYDCKGYNYEAEYIEVEITLHKKQETYSQPPNKHTPDKSKKCLAPLTVRIGDPDWNKRVMRFPKFY